MSTKQEILAVKQKLFALCQQYIWETVKPVFDAHPCLSYFHYARLGDKRQDRHLAVNGIRWQDLDFFIHAIDFELTRRDTDPVITEGIKNTLDQLPNYKALRAAVEDLYHALADLTTQGVFTMIGDNAFRILAVREGAVSYRPLGKEERDLYPTNPSQDD